MLIPKALNISIFYLFIVWSLALFREKDSPFVTYSIVYLLLLTAYWLLVNITTLIICNIYKKKYERINLIGLLGGIIAFASMVLILEYK